MRMPKLSLRNVAIGIGGAIVVIVIAGIFAFQPVTRNLVAADSVCAFCHLEREYSAAARLSFSVQHPAELEEGQSAARCVDCHLPEGVLRAAAAYSHYLSATDLFGRFRDRAAERASEWVPMSAARAHRVRERLLEYDGAPCRTCHIEGEIKFSRKRGENAHKKALEEKQTCIECHYNLVHREVEFREDEAELAEASGEN